MWVEKLQKVTLLCKEILKTKILFSHKQATKDFAMAQDGTSAQEGTSALFSNMNQSFQHSSFKTAAALF